MSSRTGLLKPKFLRFALGIAVALCLAPPAHADWLVAQSPHFVVYADDREEDLKTFAEQLERYHQALLLVTGQNEAAAPSPSNRLTIFVAGNDRKVKKLAGENAVNVAGFYVPRAGGSRAFVPSIRLSSRETDFSMIVLMHEYAHHFLMSASPYGMPRWYNEGAAEFFSSAKFDRDGSVWIGMPARHRAGELNRSMSEVKLVELLDHELYDQKRRTAYDDFYGRAWLLYHYLVFEKSRSGQLKTYALEIMNGKPVRAAAEKAFGDIKVLQKEVDNYLMARRMPTFKLKPEMLPAVTVNVSRLSEGEGKVMPLRMRSQRGVDRETAAEVVADVREVAERYPDDPGVLTALAEAEFDAGFNDAAIAAADRALATDPSRANAYVQKGYALFRKASELAEAGGEAEDAFSQTLKPFQALNRIENDHPLPLVYYYQSFEAQGKEPPELARHALERASQLAPFDRGLAFATALMHAREGKIELARMNFDAIAADPHGGQLAATSGEISQTLSLFPEGQAWLPEALDKLQATLTTTEADVE